MGKENAFLLKAGGVCLQLIISNLKRIQKAFAALCSLLADGSSQLLKSNTPRDVGWPGNGRCWSHW